MKMDKTYACVPSLKVAFVGLGVMGFPMAGHLKLAGHDVCVYNRTTVSYTHLTLPTTSRRQRQMCIRDRCLQPYYGQGREVG